MPHRSKRSPSRRLGRRDALGAALGIAAAPWLVGCEPPPPPRLAPASARLRAPNARPETIASRPAMDGAGARVRRLFPMRPGDHQDPFVLLDDFGVAPPAGFPMHPHRGFEAFTYMTDGAFHHRDTMGNDSVVRTGGTQRFTSGRGARHSEMPAAEQINRGLQLWVNLPRHLKRIEPEYAAVRGADIPENGGRGSLVVRTVVGPQSPSVLRTAVTYLDVRSRARSRWEAEVPERSKALLYVLEGQVKVGDVDVPSGTAALPVPGELVCATEGAARFVFLAGASHDEPIRHRGPFVD